MILTEVFLEPGTAVALLAAYFGDLEERCAGRIEIGAVTVALGEVVGEGTRLMGPVAAVAAVPL